MPQISPMSWLSILLVFSLSFLMVKSHLSPFNFQPSKKAPVKSINKKFSW